MQVIGVCRFSFPAHGGFQVEHDSIEERCAFLYSDARMSERFRHFETLTLPSIRAQTDEDFTFLIVIGDNLPDKWKSRLYDLTADVEQIKIRALPPMPHREAMKTAVNDIREKTGMPCLQFRHDDDDAVALTFVERLRATAEDCRPFLDQHRFVAFDWAKGFIARPCAEGIYAEETFHPYWGVAQAISVRPHIWKTVMNFSHGRINRFMPTITFDDPPMYLRGHNDYNDSRQGKNVSQPKLELMDALGEDMMREMFNVDADHIRQVFAHSSA